MGSRFSTLPTAPGTWETKVKAESTKDKTFLFGGAGIESQFQSDFTLLLQVDVEGERIEIRTRRDLDTGDFRVGYLEPGETFAIRLENLVYVAAIAQHDTYVRCSLLSDKGG